VTNLPSIQIVSEPDPKLVWGDISILDKALERNDIEAVGSRQDDGTGRGVQLVTFEAAVQEDHTAIPTLSSQDHGLAEQIVGFIMDELLANDLSLPDALIPIDAIEKVTAEGEEPVDEFVEKSYSGAKGKGRAIEDEAPAVCYLVASRFVDFSLIDL
jgi:hypothetical protein